MARSHPQRPECSNLPQDTAPARCRGSHPRRVHIFYRLDIFPVKIVLFHQILAHHKAKGIIANLVVRNCIDRTITRACSNKNSGSTSFRSGACSSIKSSKAKNAPLETFGWYLFSQLCVVKADVKFFTGRNEHIHLFIIAAVIVNLQLQLRP